METKNDEKLPWNFQPIDSYSNFIGAATIPNLAAALPQVFHNVKRFGGKTGILKRLKIP